MELYYFVDSDGTENVSNMLPIRDEKGFWTCEIHITDNLIYEPIKELPSGTIEELFKIKLTWNDNPIKHIF